MILLQIRLIQPLNIPESCMKKISLFSCGLITIFFQFTCFAADTIVVRSLTGSLQFKLFSDQGQLSFAITSGSVAVIEKSRIVLTLDDAPLTSNVKIGKVENYKINETYPWLGVHTPAINRCNGTKVSLDNGKKKYILDIRMFDDGAAFRLSVPLAAGKEREAGQVPDETTSFKIPSGSLIWYHDMYMHYEGVHTKKNIDSLTEGEWVAPPATFRLPTGLYASITEANLKNYAGLSLQADGKNGLMIRLPQHQPTSYPYRLRYSPEDTLRLMQPAKFFSDIITPWRVVMIGDLNALVNSDIVHNLCPPPDKKFFPNGIYTGWIKPGRAVWKYLDGGGDGTVEVMKKFTDGAASLGFEHNILEGFWTK